MDAVPTTHISEGRSLGLARWRVLLATAFCYMFYYTGRQSFGFAIPGIESEFGVSKEDLGWISACALWCYGLGQLVNGNLGDRFGGRRLVALGAILSCAACWMVSFADSILFLGVAWAINNYFQSLGWAPGGRVLSNWWRHERRGFAFGIYTFSAGISTVLTYSLCLLIIRSWEMDWRHVFRWPVLLLIVGGTVYFLLVRDRPEDEGFRSIHGDQQADGARPGDAGSDGDDAAAPTTLKTDGLVAESIFRRNSSVLTQPGFLLACLVIGFQSLARYGLLSWAPVHFLGDGWKEADENIWFLLALPAGMAVGALSSGMLSDFMFGSRRRPIIVGSLAVASVVSLALYFVPREHPASMALLFVCGFCAYGPQSALWALCPDLLEQRRVGTGVGIMNASAYAMAGMGQPLVGWAMERYDDTALVFPIVAGACACGALLACWIRR